MNQQKNILFVEGLASFNPAIPLEILVKLHIFFLKLPGLQLFRERLSNKTVCNNAERYYGSWDFMDLD